MFIIRRKIITLMTFELSNKNPRFLTPWKCLLRDYFYHDLVNIILFPISLECDLFINHIKQNKHRCNLSLSRNYYVIILSKS